MRLGIGLFLGGGRPPSPSTEPVAIARFDTALVTFDSDLFTWDQDVDTTPDAFSFSDAIDAPLGTYMYGDTFALDGTDADSPIFATGAGEYQVEDGPWRQDLSFAPPQSAISYRVLSSEEFDTEAPNALSIGGVTASMLVRTAAADITPDAIAYTAVTDAELSTHYQQSFTLSGTTAAAPFTTSGGATVSLDGGATLLTSGSIDPAASFIIDMFSSSSYDALAHGIVNIGGLEIPCDVTSKADPSPTPTPTPIGVPAPKEGAADITVSFTGATTTTARQTRIKDAMAAALLEMQGAADPTNHPLKIAIPAASCGSLFLDAGDFPSQLSVVPVDYANPPTFQRFAHTGSGLHNVVFDGLKIFYPSVPRFGPIMAFTGTRNITVSNWQITSYDPTIPNGSEEILSFAPATSFVEVSRLSFEARTNGWMSLYSVLNGTTDVSGTKIDSYIEYSIDGGTTWVDTRPWGSSNEGVTYFQPSTSAPYTIFTRGFACRDFPFIGAAAGSTVTARLLVQKTGTGTIAAVTGYFRAACTSGLLGVPIQTRGTENFTLYRTEVVGGETSQHLIAQKVDTSPLNPSVNTRVIECSFRGGNEDSIRPWGAENFLIQDTFIGLGGKAWWFHEQHADGIQIAQLANPNAFPSSGTIDNCMVAQLDEQSEVEGLMMTDWNVQYTGPIVYTDNTIIGCGLNSIKAAHVASGGVTITGNRVYGLRYASADTARIVLDSVTGITFLDNQSEQLVASGTTYAVGGASEHSTPSSQGLASKLDAQALIDTWKAAHPDVPFNLPNVDVPGFTLV